MTSILDITIVVLQAFTNNTSYFPEYANLYKNDKLIMVPRNGVSITYSEKSGDYHEVLA